MLDFDITLNADDLFFYSDASASKRLEFGCVFENSWIFGRWGRNFIEQYEPSIEYLELFGLVAGILTWQDHPKLNNKRVILYCDNQAVVSMVNNLTSSCPNCMHLIRILVLNCMVHNRRVFVRWVLTKSNGLADSLSRIDLMRFRRLGPQMNKYPDKIHADIWPISKVWRCF